MKVRIHIERLVLEGLPVARGGSALLQAAVESELSRLVGEGGIHSSLVSGGALAHAAGDRMEFQSGAKPAALGAQIARAAYKGFGQ
jgi:hypothetical protein